MRPGLLAPQAPHCDWNTNWAVKQYLRLLLLLLLVLPAPAPPLVLLVFGPSGWDCACDGKGVGVDAGIWLSADALGGERGGPEGQGS